MRGRERKVKESMDGENCDEIKRKQGRERKKNRNRKDRKCTRKNEGE